MAMTESPVRGVRYGPCDEPDSSPRTLRGDAKALASPHKELYARSTRARGCVSVTFSAHYAGCGTSEWPVSCAALCWAASYREGCRNSVPVFCGL